MPQQNDITALQHIARVIRESDPAIDATRAGKIALDLLKSGVRTHTANEDDIRERIANEIRAHAAQAKADASSPILGNAIGDLLDGVADGVFGSDLVDLDRIVRDLVDDGWEGGEDTITRDDLNAIARRVLLTLGLRAQ